jgi:hypothetical protein
MMPTPAPLPLPLPLSEADALHRDIVNLPCSPPFPSTPRAAVAYRTGFAAARHAAAELAMSRVAALEEKVRRLQRSLRAWE